MWCVLGKVGILWALWDGESHGCLCLEETGMVLPWMASCGLLLCHSHLLEPA